MAFKDAELSKAQAGLNKREMENIVVQVRHLLSAVPDKVNNGSIQTAISFKKAAAKGHDIISGKRVSLHNAQQCVAALKAFYS